jgi:hypothetical protein
MKAAPSSSAVLRPIPSRSSLPTAIPNDKGSGSSGDYAFKHYSPADRPSEEPVILIDPHAWSALVKEITKEI